MLIASRRQIETKKISNGYVDNLTTKKYSNLLKKFKNKNLIPCRDHGGPYQGINEKKMSKKKAMHLAKISLKADIENNFKVIHIDPSISPENKIISKKTIINDIIELIDFCHEYSQKRNKKIFFEIGTEEPSCFTGTNDELEDLVDEIITKLNLNKLPSPLFCVLQTGTRVKELSNFGDLNNLKLIKNFLKIKKISNICKNNNLMLKQHNTDYLKYRILKQLPKLNIDAVNIAPEFGYVESFALFKLLKEKKKNKLLDNFLELSYNSKKWEKWLNKNSKLSDLEKAFLWPLHFWNKVFQKFKKKYCKSFHQILI